MDTATVRSVVLDLEEITRRHSGSLTLSRRQRNAREDIATLKISSGLPTLGCLPHARSSFRRHAVGLVILIGLLLGAALLALNTGAAGLHVLDLMQPGDLGELARTIILESRMPRFVLGFLIGAGLAMAGGALQGLFRNPLADPALIGVSGGATVAAALTIVFGATAQLSVAAAAMVGGLAATMLVYAIASPSRHTAIATLLLAGVAVNALAGAIVGLLVFLADNTALRSLAFWSLGSLWGASWERIGLVGLLIGLPLVIFPRLARSLNLMLLGEDEARSLGRDPIWIRRAVVALTACTVGAGVALAGTIGFVGLIVPHLIRLVFGPDHRFLLPAAGILGGTLLVLADVAARNLAGAAELPVGALTALAGAPFFLLLLLLRRRAWIV